MDGSYYIGSTNNLEDRLNRHNQGRTKYTKTKRPWDLVYCEEHTDRPSASKREYALKRRKSKGHIEAVIKSFPGKA
jgi:putative endonuclease